jgi:hypothetical protein
MDGLVCIKLDGGSAAIDTDMMDLWRGRLPALLEGYEPGDIYTEMRWTSSTVAFQIECCHKRPVLSLERKLPKQK